MVRIKSINSQITVNQKISHLKISKTKFIVLQLVIPTHVSQSTLTVGQCLERYAPLVKTAKSINFSSWFDVLKLLYIDSDTIYTNLLINNLITWKSWCKISCNKSIYFFYRNNQLHSQNFSTSDFPCLSAHAYTSAHARFR